MRIDKKLKEKKEETQQIKRNYIQIENFGISRQ